MRRLGSLLSQVFGYILRENFGSKDDDGVVVGNIWNFGLWDMCVVFIFIKPECVSAFPRRNFALIFFMLLLLFSGK